MKKSNKATVVYVISSVLLFLVLFAGGIYGIYLSIGINFMRSNVSNVTDAVDGDGVANVSYGATANFQPSMIGIIILSAVLVLISVCYFISLIKQLVFFKQFKLIRESKLEHMIEKKIKSKSSVLFFAFLLNILSFIVGATGIFVNIKTFVSGAMSWILYLIDGLVVVLSIISIISLIKKLRMLKHFENNRDDAYDEKGKNTKEKNFDSYNFNDKNRNEYMSVGKGEKMKVIDELEYVLFKLKSMKDNKVISNDEYEYMRARLMGKSTKRRNNKSTQNEIAN